MWGGEGRAVSCLQPPPSSLSPPIVARYEVAKNERNAVANSIQAASQAIAEQARGRGAGGGLGRACAHSPPPSLQRERLKILRNEVDILQNESLAKEKALAKERQEHAAAVAQRKREGGEERGHTPLPLSWPSPPCPPLPLPQCSSTTRTAPRCCTARARTASRRVRPPAAAATLPSPPIV